MSYFWVKLISVSLEIKSYIHKYCVSHGVGYDRGNFSIFIDYFHGCGNCPGFFTNRNSQGPLCSVNAFCPNCVCCGGVTE